MASFVVVIKDPDGNTVQGITLDVLNESQKGLVGKIGPSNSLGQCFGSLEPESYYFSLPVVPRYTILSLQLFEVVGDGYQEFEYTIYPSGDGIKNIADVVLRLRDLERILTTLAEKQKALLTESDQEQLEDHLADVLAKLTVKKNSFDDKYQEYLTKLNAVIDQYSSDYWGQPVDTPDDLPSSDRSYKCRLVILPAEDEDPAIYVKNPDAGWTRLTGI